MKPIDLTEQEARDVVEALTKETTKRRDTEGDDSEGYRRFAKILAKIEEHYFN